MRAALIQRIILFIPGVWFVATAVFLVMRVLPGDPAAAIVGGDAPLEAVQAMRVRLGLDRPLWEQYLGFLIDLARGHLGTSLVSNQLVATILAAVLPQTVALALSGMFLGVIVGVPAGLVAAVKRDSIVDASIRLGAAVFYSVPVFYVGVLLLILFAVNLGWFPMIGSGSTPSLAEYMRQLTLPALSLGLGMAAYVMRVTRSSVIEVLAEDYVRTAHAKGLGSKLILYRHVLRNALLPIITIVALYLGILMGGAILTETVFNRPGVGKVLLLAIQNRDYIVVQSTLVMYALFVMVVNLFVDVLYAVADPTIRT